MHTKKFYNKYGLFRTEIVNRINFQSNENSRSIISKAKTLITMLITLSRPSPS